MAQHDTETSTRSAHRLRHFGPLLVILLVVGIFLAWNFLVGHDVVTTDNAYVHGNVVVVTPQVTGTVISIHAEETARVEAGQMLIRLDTTDSSNQLRHQSARLARVIRETSAMYPEAERLRSTIMTQESAVERAKTELMHAEEKLRRREALKAGGMVAQEQLQEARVEFDRARSAVAAAQSSEKTARDGLDVQLALTAGVTIQQHPLVEEAASDMREAWLAVKRAEIRAPLSGHVAQRSVQIGQRVAPGANLMSVVDLTTLWVEANFKETQLGQIRVGQPATLTADIYGSSVTYRGRVTGLGIGTGAAFALLPPQNATGNWIKILQRVPVRIALDPRELAGHPLRLGLSMRVSVDTSDRSGPMLSPAAPPAAILETRVFGELESAALEAIRRVIETHLRTGTGAKAKPRSDGKGARP